MDFFKKNWGIILLLLASIVLHFSFLHYPPEAVFDEIYFGTYANSYFTHQYYFDLHPPLGKLLIAGVAKISGIKSGFDLNQIGEKFNAKSLFVLRFLPALLGSLIPLLIYLLLLEIGTSKKTAYLGAFLAVFDNALLTQSKFILLDSFLLFFGFCALYFFLKSRQETNPKRSLVFFTASVALATCSFSIKWTGLSWLGIIVLLFSIDSFKKRALKIFFIKAAILLLLPFIIYYAIFLIHFQLLYKSGQGDAFMSAQFQKTLEQNSAYQAGSSMSNWQKFIELNEAMYSYNASLTAGHPNASKWYQWPIDKKMIWYWTDSQNGKTANIYLFGNPIIWWLVLYGIIFSLFALLVKEMRQKLPPIFWLLMLGYFINILPFILIGRVVFLYHYLTSLLFGILILSILYEKVLAPSIVEMTSKKGESFLYATVLLICFLSFLILCPLSYGFFVKNPSGLNNFYQNFIKFLS